MAEVKRYCITDDLITFRFIFSYRFMDLFGDSHLVRDMQKELDQVVIQQGVVQLTRLLKNSETKVSSGSAAAPDEDEFTLSRQRQNYFRGRYCFRLCQK